MMSIVDKRVVATKTVFSTRRGRRLIYTFIGLVAILLTAVAVKVWPIVNVVIKPNLLSAAADLAINIQVDSPRSSLATLTLPGRFMLPGEDEGLLMSGGMVIRRINNETIIFSESEWLTLVVQALQKQLPGGAVLLLPTLKITEHSWQKQSSGNLFRSEISASISYYLNLPLDKWAAEIKGLSIDEAAKTLRSKPGVSEVSIEYFPKFLANFSQKLPNNQSIIRLSLDTN